MKIEIPGHVYGYHWGDPERTLSGFYFSAGEPKDTEYAMALAPYTVVLEMRELPSSDEVTQHVVEALRAEKQETYARAAREAARIDEKISELLALTNEVKS